MKKLILLGSIILFGCKNQDPLIFSTPWKVIETINGSHVSEIYLKDGTRCISFDFGLSCDWKQKTKRIK